MTRVSTGSAARRGMALMAGLLVVIVGFVVVNRPPPQTAPSPTNMPVAAAPSLHPTPTPSCNPLLARPAPFVPDRFAVAMNITGGRLRAVLEPDGADAHVATLKIESAAVWPTLGIELGWQRDAAGLSLFDQFGAWEVPLEPVLGSHGAQVELLVVQVRPLAELPVRYTLVPNGYTFTVLGRRTGRYLSLRTELLWPAAPVAGHAGPRGNADEAGCLES
jgi:hypothetical protein